MVHELTRKTQIEKFIADYKNKISDVEFLIERNNERRHLDRNDVDLLIEKHKLNAQRQAYVQSMKDFELLLDLD